MWVVFIDNNVTDKMGFENTTHDCCIYKKVIDGNVVYLFRQIDNLGVVVSDQNTAEKMFNIIGTKIRFKDKEDKGIIPFHFLGVIICDYHGVDIKQTSHYIDMFSETNINCLTKLHIWDITTQSSSSGKNKNNNVEAAAAAQVQMSKIDSKNEIPFNPYLNI